jgi:hypothetical protein
MNTQPSPTTYPQISLGTSIADPEFNADPNHPAGHPRSEPPDPVPNHRGLTDDTSACLPKEMDRSLIRTAGTQR